VFILFFGKDIVDIFADLLQISDFEMVVEPIRRMGWIKDF
jgi:hypothetical protein